MDRFVKEHAAYLYGESLLSRQEPSANGYRRMLPTADLWCAHPPAVPAVSALRSARPQPLSFLLDLDS